MTIPSILIEKGYTLSDYKLKQGGQSTTQIVLLDNLKYVLKRPLDCQLSTYQRFRMQQEVRALMQLEGNNTPNVIEYNLESDEPFILLNYINGKTLNDYVNGAKIELDIAIKILKQICVIVSKAHELGLQHRDIKPDNIILDKDNTIYLIDFGLCRIEDTNTEIKTPKNSELGNRFLRLPEFSKGEKITSSVSDITFIVGIFYFMITGKSPIQLLDANFKPPHKRENVIDTNWLNYFFDKGFAYNISARFKNTQEMIDFIEKRGEIIENETKKNIEFEYLINTLEFKRLNNAINLLINAQREYFKGVTEASSNISIGMAGPNQEYNTNNVICQFHFTPIGQSSPRTDTYNFISKLDDNFLDIAHHSELIDLSNFNLKIVEEDRILNEYYKLGLISGQIALRNLTELLKKSQ